MARNLSVSPDTIRRIHSRVAAQGETIARIVREICAIPAMNSLIGPVGERIGAEMRKLRIEDVRGEVSLHNGKTWQRRRTSIVFSSKWMTFRLHEGGIIALAPYSV